MKFLLTAFITGACVMLIELTASRLLAPFFGASLYVWTNVIGIIMVALTIGYWVGGRVAEKTKNPRVLGMLIAVAGVTTGLIPLLLRPLARVTTDTLFTRAAPGSLIVFLGSFAVLLVLFAVPILLLGMVSPFVIRLLTLNNAETGIVAGRVFAVSTLGSILGTFFPVLVLVPAIGSQKTMLAASALLVVTGLALAMRTRRTAVATVVLVAVVFGTSIVALPTQLRAREGLVYEKESAYQYISVQEEPVFGRTLRFNEGLGIQSMLPTPTAPTTFYWHDIPALLSTAPTREDGTRRMLLIGLAGGTIPTLVEQSWGDRVTITGVEVDPDVVDTARRFFSLNDLKNLDVRVADGRVVVATDPTQYDFLLVDAYTNQLYIPPHLATAEFFALAKTRLTSGGVLAANVVAFSEKSLLFRRIVASIQTAFPHVGIINDPGTNNFLILASENPITWRDLPPAATSFLVDRRDGLQARFREVPKETAPPLTDDDAPVELLTDTQIFELLKTR